MKRQYLYCNGSSDYNVFDPINFIQNMSRGA